MPERLDCCYIGEVSGLQCGNAAEWSIEWNEYPDGHTLSCTRHVGDMLGEAIEHRVYPVEARPQHGTAKEDK